MNAARIICLVALFICQIGTPIWAQQPQQPPNSTSAPGANHKQESIIKAKEIIGKVRANPQIKSKVLEKIRAHLVERGATDVDTRISQMSQILDTVVPMDANTFKQQHKQYVRQFARLLRIKHGGGKHQNQGNGGS